MEVLAPVIIPGGGRFKSSVLVAVRAQSVMEKHDVIRWRFSMSQSGRSNAENGPTIEGRIPARLETPFEECYQFGGSKMGYRRSSVWGEGGQFNFEFAVPGVYRVFAWVEREGAPVSCTQNCLFEIFSASTDNNVPSVSLGC